MECLGTYNLPELYHLNVLASSTIGGMSEAHFMFLEELLSNAVEPMYFNDDGK